MSEYFTLTPLLVGKFVSFPLKRFLFGHKGEEVVQAPCISWLAQGSKGESILVDTGPAEPTGVTSTFHSSLEVRHEHRIDVVLRAIGIDPAEITRVVFTHLHFDHCSYADYLPNARIYVQKTELCYAVAPRDEHRRGYEVGYRSVIPSWMSCFDKMEAIEGDIEIIPGFSILSLPGHTPGSSGAVFNTKRGKFAVAGDLVNQVENWGTNSDHILPALHFDAQECHRSFLRLELETDFVLASHDYRMFDQDVYG